MEASFPTGLAVDIMMEARNPFDLPYLTEGRFTAEGLLKRYSFRLFTHLSAQIGRPSNAFVIGRKGVGKTMLIKLFDPELVAELYASTEKEHANVRALLPQATVGAYINLAHPFTRVELFAAHPHGAGHSTGAFSDYLDCVLLQASLESLERLASIEHWRARNTLSVENPLVQPGFVKHFTALLARESSWFEGIDTIAGLRQALETRVQRWARFMNRDPAVQEPPPAPLPLGTTLFHFVKAIRAAELFSEPFRLFILVDQFEILQQFSDSIDLRPAFNQAMYHALRGSTGVEFKIATRRYSRGNLSLMSGKGSIEADREYIDVDMDRIKTKEFRRFFEELFEKRMMAGGIGKPSTKASARLAAFDPHAEASAHCGNSADPRHLKPFARRWEHYGVAPGVAEKIWRSAKLAEAHPLEATLACIAATRWIRDGRREPPLRAEAARDLSGDAELEAYLKQLVISIRRRYELGTTSARKAGGHLKAVDDFVHDVETSALFQIAASFKNQRKIYSGFDELVMVSSNVAVVFIEILRSAYEQLLLNGGNPYLDQLDARTQSEAVYQVAANYFERIPRECDFGIRFQRFLRGLGAGLRALQLEPTVPIPSPNGISLAWQDVEQVEYDERAVRVEPTSLIISLVSWGLLEESEHQDKTRGQARRTRFRVNRILCPYFGVSSKHRKDPPYIVALAAFVDAAINDGTTVDTAEFARLLGRASGATEHSEQIRLI